MNNTESVRITPAPRQEGYCIYAYLIEVSRSGPTAPGLTDYITYVGCSLSRRGIVLWRRQVPMEPLDPAR